MTWKIIPLDLGSITPPGRKPGPATGWLLVRGDGGRKVLVDAGPAESEAWGTQYHNPFTRSQEQRLEQALQKHHTALHEIDTVFLTHLHWDHGYGILKLPHAKVVVQRRELQYAVAPDPSEGKHYETNIPTQLPYFLSFYHQFSLVEGDLEYEPGLTLLTLPGHSPGSQGVLVSTAEGPYLIAGDLVTYPENWERREPPGICNSVTDVYRSYEKIERLGAVVLAAHDPKVFPQLLGEDPYHVNGI